jgi:hypothetical protein
MECCLQCGRLVISGNLNGPNMQENGKVKNIPMYILMYATGKFQLKKWEKSRTVPCETITDAAKMIEEIRKVLTNNNIAHKIQDNTLDDGWSYPELDITLTKENLMFHIEGHEYFNADGDIMRITISKT